MELTLLGFVIANWDKVSAYFKRFVETIKPYFKVIAGIFSPEASAELKLTDGRKIPVKDLADSGPALPSNLSQPIRANSTRNLTQVVNEKNDFHMLSNEEGSRKAVEHGNKGVREPFKQKVNRMNLDPIGAF